MQPRIGIKARVTVKSVIACGYILQLKIENFHMLFYRTEQEAKD